MPQVSVIIPTYNCAQYILQAIDSVRSQTLEDHEIVVVDDGSTDGTRQRLEPYLGDIRYIYQKNQERSAARNVGIRHASGEFIAFLDADDFWLPTYLERQSAYLDAHPVHAMSYTWAYGVDPDGLVVREPDAVPTDLEKEQGILARLLVANRLKSCAVVIRKRCLESVGLFDPELRQGEDWDLWLRIAIRYPVGCIPAPLSCYRLYNSFLPERMVQRGIERAYPRIVERAFSLLDESSPLQALKSRALCAAHWRAAWALYAVGDLPRAQAQMMEAYVADPAFFSPPYTELVESVGYLADELYDVTTPLEKALACTERLFANLPPWAQHLRHLRRRAVGQCAGVSLFRSYQQRDWPAVRRAGLCAVRCRPAWLRNRGFLSILVRSLLHPGPARARPRRPMEFQPHGT